MISRSDSDEYRFLLGSQAKLIRMSRYMLVKGKAGLGNRLLALLGSLVYARITSRQLYVDWSDRGYSKDRTNSFPHFFSRPQLADKATIWSAENVAPAVWRGHLDLSVDELMAKFEDDVEADGDPSTSRKYTIDPGRIDYDEDVVIRWAWTDELFRMQRHFPPELRGVATEALLRSLVREELELAPAVRARVDEFARKELGDVSIGLHIRASDRKNSWSMYPRIVDKLRRTWPNLTVFVATDNKDVENELRRRYPRVVSSQKWYAPAGVPLHRSRDCPDKLESGIEALVDMYLLGRCNYLVYNNTSTFGVFASLTSEAPPENIYETSPRLSKGIRLAQHWMKLMRTRMHGMSDQKSGPLP